LQVCNFVNYSDGLKGLEKDRKTTVAGGSIHVIFHFLWTAVLKLDLLLRAFGHKTDSRIRMTPHAALSCCTGAWRMGPSRALFNHESYVLCDESFPRQERWNKTPNGQTGMPETQIT
jgi:hypothetical protein